MGTHPIFESDFDCLTVMESFFGKTETKFSAINLDNGVQVIPFLNACREYGFFYDLFGGTVFMPIKADVNGNINKLQGWYDADKNNDTLEKILENEINNGTTESKGSATDALLWLKRGLWMMVKFMQSMLNGERNATKSFNAAYEVSLKPHHGWMVQKMFGVGLSMIPDYQGFLIAMTSADFSGNKEEVVMREMGEYISSLNDVLLHIDQFYISKKLKNP